jgi:hypothetical protein
MVVANRSWEQLLMNHNMGHYIRYSAVNGEGFEKARTPFVPIGGKMNIYNNPTDEYASYYKIAVERSFCYLPQIFVIKEKI